MSQQQVSVSVSPLRRRRLDDMAMRGLREDARRNDVMSVRNFVASLGRLLPPVCHVSVRLATPLTCSSHVLGKAHAVHRVLTFDLRP